MAKKILNIVESGYRAISEEQDDTIIWITTVLQQNGGDISVLLKGNATSYLQSGQKAPALSFGDWEQTHPPDVPKDIDRLLKAGAKVFYVEEDLAERGVQFEKKDGPIGVSKSALGKLMVDADLVFHW